MALNTGMDVGQVQQLATMMAEAADKLNSLADSLTAQLGNTPWEGNDRQKFNGDWQHLQQVLRRVATMLKDTSTKLRREAEQQETASQ